MTRRRLRRHFITKIIACAECGNAWTLGALIGCMREDETWSCKCTEAFYKEASACWFMGAIENPQLLKPEARL